MHRGRIEVLDSDLGGARFEVTLPHQLTPAGMAVATDASYDRTLLVGVLEELRMNRFISESLSGPYDVISAFDGREGLEKALATQPALIVTDLMCRS